VESVPYGVRVSKAYVAAYVVLVPFCLFSRGSVYAVHKLVKRMSHLFG